MFKANKQVSRNAKTEAIVELMGLEGFKHQYDSRTVEKLCAGFTGMKRRVSREKPPGRLKEESPQISDGAKVPRSY